MTTAYQRRSPTSRAAAVRAQGKARSKRELIVEYVWQQGVRGATRDEIARALGMPIQTVCGRVAEELAPLDAKGHAREPRLRMNGERRETRQGSPAYVLVARTAPYVEQQLCMPLQRLGGAA